MHTPTTPATIEGLPTHGPMGGNPALTVAGLMALGAMIVALLGASGIWVPSPELRQFFDDWGVQLAGLVIAAYGLVQGAITRAKVFSPQTVAEEYRPKSSSIGRVVA